MGLIEAGLVFYILLCTFVLNKWRPFAMRSNVWHRLAYIVGSIIMGIAPLIYIQDVAPDHTAIAVILSGVAVFWLSIVASRSAHT